MARVFSRYPTLVERWARSRRFVINPDTPWVRLTRELRECQIALVTTAGVHLRSQPPFDMQDREGDPSFREIPRSADPRNLVITHNYYDHQDADRDVNVVFPIERLMELEGEGAIGRVAPRHFSFMGHIIGRRLDTLVKSTGPEVARRLREDGVDAVFLTPA